MTRLILRRLALLVPTLLGLSVLLFLWVRALPGGPATALLGERATPEAVARVNELYGFDKPLVQQYLTWLGQLLQGNFGVSTRTGRPVLEEFVNRFPATIELTVVALVIAIGVAIPLGYVAARRQGRPLDHLTVLASLVGVTIPVFFLAFLLKWLFAVQLGWFPSSGRQDPTMVATHPTGFYVLDGILTREWDASWDALLHLVLPAVALGSIPLAIIARITRSSVIEVQDADYVRTARAKGLGPSRLRRRVILRNAMLPVATTIGLQVGLLLSGAVLTETVFAFPGIGSFLSNAVFNLDYAVLQGFILIIAVVYALVNLVVDVSYGLIDPRTRATR
ncbi:ABC transporter permease [Cellulomonas fimi]|uniref:Binding-protein-dependent transport systems inner membrane component n=1 Tax=Cellulomonas fimi (strain ATCC 484 / DSM 20113 / JCM 1341 / CCUG 24087 / LMG 16345 / NBRC 15513 / NCIMB 8980 / NCTC 7547 / NRS-133) TaxID=590998 RepID=F4GYY4_CELFA|nr:ABC transporter permease [Cellulomonas fimi]AEE45974.1 binding-protein-dependent transport systems inner membrane component [Cellulomonas fimi ATCC 484]NNH06560.1 ABC transporter permease [Cellulomonas fimi]VEH31164.1 Dipeptide transport system permease protein dppB [Cellulomonas fimi]